jgi:SAM-dependent methyltransferase
MPLPAILLVPAGLVILGLLLAGLRLRRRLNALQALPPADGSAADTGGFRAVTAAGVTVPEEVRLAAAAHARREGLDVVDLVPSNLPMVEAYRLADAVDPATFRTDRLARGRGAGHALVVSESLVDRAGVTAMSDLDPVAFVRLTERLKHYAPTGCDLVVVPGLGAAPADAKTYKARLRALNVPRGITMGGAAAGYGLLAAAVLAYPAWGWLALVVYSAQPYLVLAGTPVRPRDRHRAALLRLLMAPVRWWREVRGGWRSPYDADFAALHEQARAEYRAELAQGTDRFFEPRRDTCPWCGDRRLSVHVRTRDRIQIKPGRFTLDKCRACGHVFQNPRLSLTGLDFYYRDVYDRLGEASVGVVFGASDGSYRGRTELVRRFTTPRTWLDIGTGHGHFCLYAKGVLTGTIFDGLDMGESIEEAQRRGWVATGFRGQFPDLAEKLAGNYDIVSMHHYLEHTRDPFVELDAVARVLNPGGYLLIELPNPAFGLARVLGGYWMPWLQPQHLNMMPLPNLEAALRDRGLDPVAREVGPAHQHYDVTVATMLFLNSLAPSPDRPWAPSPPTRVGHLRRGLIFTAAIPVLIAAVLIDQIATAVLRRTDGANAYRVLARRV